MKFDLGYLMDSVGTGEDFYNMLKIFLESTPKILTALNQSFAENDLQKVADNAHKLKSTIDILKIRELQSPVREINKYPEIKEKMVELPQIIQKINRTMNQVLNEIKENYLLEK